jgi:hypothetical protein
MKPPDRAPSPLGRIEIPRADVALCWKCDKARRVTRTPMVRSRRFESVGGPEHNARRPWIRRISMLGGQRGLGSAERFEQLVVGTNRCRRERRLPAPVTQFSETSSRPFGTT